MKTSAGLPHRISVRVPHYNYCVGSFFITICTYQRRCILGRIEADEMKLSPIGLIVDREWRRTSEIRAEVELDDFVVMPNHLHAIVDLKVQDALPRVPTRGRKLWRSPRSLGSLVGGFKAKTTTEVRRLIGDPASRLWQPGFHECIIRNERDLDRFRRYIAENPARWAYDRENPSCTTEGRDARQRVLHPRK